MGPTQEFSTIQKASDAALPGDTVLVYPGTYAGFVVANSGTSANPITFKTAGAVILNTPSSTGHGIYINRSSYIVIDGFQIQNMPQTCVAARGATPTSPMSGVVIRNNTCNRAQNGGFYLSELNNSLVENNRIWDIATTHGLYLANAGSDNTVIRGNTIYSIHGADAAGMHFNGDLSIGGDGLISGLVVENNVIYDVFFNGFSLDGVQNATFYNNLVYGTTRHAFRAFRVDGAAGPKNFVLVNNTFVTPSNGGWAIKISEDLGGHTIFNNILLTSNSSSGSLAVGTRTGLATANNAVVNRLSADEGSTILTLAAWQNNNDGQNSFVSTPAALFVNESSTDYRLLPSAPAIDKGIALFKGASAPLKDLLGTRRPQGKGFDLGAYENVP